MRRQVNRQWRQKEEEDDNDRNLYEQFFFHDRDAGNSVGKDLELY